MTPNIHLIIYFLLLITNTLQIRLNNEPKKTDNNLKNDPLNETNLKLYFTKVCYCMKLEKCQSMIEILKNVKIPIPNWLLDKLRRSSCGFENNEPMVCCPEKQNHTQIQKSPMEEQLNANDLPKNRFTDSRLSTRRTSRKTIATTTGTTSTTTSEKPWIWSRELIMNYENQNFIRNSTQPSINYKFLQNNNKNADILNYDHQHFKNFDNYHENLIDFEDPNTFKNCPPNFYKDLPSDYDINQLNYDEKIEDYRNHDWSTLTMNNNNDNYWNYNQQSFFPSNHLPPPPPATGPLSPAHLPSLNFPTFDGFGIPPLHHRHHHSHHLPPPLPLPPIWPFHFNEKPNTNRLPPSSSSFFDTNKPQHDTATTTTNKPSILTQFLEKPNNLLKLVNNENCGISVTTRIVGGLNVDQGQFPWMARIGYRNRSSQEISYRCAGSLINDNYIVTAAHCVINLIDSLQVSHVRLGELTQTRQINCIDDPIGCKIPQDYQISKIISNDNYDRPKYANDIALLKLIIPLNTPKITPICLPMGQFSNVDKNLMGTIGTVAGFGASKQEMPSIQWVQLPIVNTTECSISYARFSANFRFPIIVSSSQICAQGTENADACQGDSGGPLMRESIENNQRYTLIGLVSFGPRTCGISNFPGVYTRVASYINWILENIQT